MARTSQQTPAPSPAGLVAAEPADIQRLVEDLDGMLNRLRLGAIREQLDGLLEEAARRQLNLREALAAEWLGARDDAHKLWSRNTPGPGRQSLRSRQPLALSSRQKGVGCSSRSASSRTAPWPPGRVSTRSACRRRAGAPSAVATSNPT